LDTGAQRSFVSQAFAKKFKLKPIRRQNFAVTVFGEATTQYTSNVEEL
jgi:hypothetical protein